MSSPLNVSFVRIACQTILLGVAALTPLRAQLTEVNTFTNIAYQQNSVFAPATPSGFFFDFGANFTNAGDFIAGSVTYPGPSSPQALNLSGTSLSFGSPVI